MERYYIAIVNKQSGKTMIGKDLLVDEVEFNETLYEQVFDFVDGDESEVEKVMEISNEEISKGGIIIGTRRFKKKQS